MSQKPSSSGSSGNLPVVLPSATSVKPSTQQEPSKIPKPETAKKTTKPASAMKESPKKTDSTRLSDTSTLKSSVSKVETDAKETIPTFVITPHKRDPAKRKTVTKVPDVVRCPRVVATVPKVVAEVLKSPKKATKKGETKSKVISKSATEITKTPKTNKATLDDKCKKTPEKDISKSLCDVNISDKPISPKPKLDNNELIKLLSERPEISETKSGSVSPKSPSNVDNTEQTKLKQGFPKSGSSSPKPDMSKSPTKETTKEGDIVIETPTVTKNPTSLECQSKEKVKVLGKSDKSDKGTSNISDEKTDVKSAKTLKTVIKEVPKSPKKTTTTAEYLKQTLKIVESPTFNVETTEIEETISPLKQTTIKSKAFELESIDSPKDVSNICAAKKSEVETPKKVNSPKKKKVDSPKKTGSPRKRTDSDSPNKPDSPKVFVTSPSGKVLGFKELEEDVSKSPNKKSTVKSDTHKSLFPKEDSGISGSGSDCESLVVDVKTPAALTYSWYAPIEELRTPKDGEAENFTALIYGTWNKVYSWPPTTKQLPRPREITFESPSKLESVLFTCRCKPDNMDYYAPVKVIPQDEDSLVYSCQLVNNEDDVMKALRNNSCPCRRKSPLVKKIVFLPINEHYVLMYSWEEGKRYSMVNPNTAFLLYRGIPSQKELEYHIGDLKIFKRPGSVAFMAKYQE